MCGIVGCLKKDHFSEIDSHYFDSLIDSISHRGPDSNGSYINDENNVFLGHSRLAIIDLSNSANQPMISKDSRYVIVYNGELYNYKEIRETLIKYGVEFTTESDTEVVLNSYIYWGHECVNYFDGMFAFGILDNKLKNVSLFRDRAGVKPLYFLSTDSQFYFCSELKFLKKIPNLQISNKSLIEYFQNGFVQSPNTIFENVFKLNPGHSLTFSIPSFSFSIKKYFSLPKHNNSFFELSKKESKNKIKDLLVSACESRLVSDVPVGLFLSGGVDSSLVAAIVKKELSKNLETFTIGNTDKNFDESFFAKEISKNLDLENNVLTITENDIENAINLIPEIYDEPIADNSIIPMIILSNFTSKSVKVVLSGDCADELFVGYSYYKKLKQNNFNFKFLQNIFSKNVKWFEKIIFKSGFSKTSDPTHVLFQKLFNGSITDSYNSTKKIFLDFEINTLLLNSISNNCFISGEIFNSLNDVLDHDFKSFMSDDILYKVDRATMFYGLEAREPFLNLELVNFAKKIPSEYSINENENKVLLKEILEEYIPKELIYRKKMGFVVRMDSIITKNLASYKTDILSENFIDNQSIFSKYEINYIIDNFSSGRIGYTHKLWSIINFQLWYKHWFC